MNPQIGWSLAAAALLLGGWLDGWRGLLLAASVVAFWLLLQFSRAMRAMRQAAQRPMGSVASASMLHAALQPGMTMLELLKHAGSLGRPVGGETYRWADPGGDGVIVTLVDGRLTQWQLDRGDERA